MNPHTLAAEAEQNVLGALLLNNQVLGHVSRVLSPQHFIEPLHAKIYEAISDQIASGRAATPITVCPSLGTGEVAQGVTAQQYLTRLYANTAAVVDAIDQAELIRDMSVMRRLSVVGTQLAALSGQPREQLAKAFDEIDAVRAELLGATSRRAAVGSIGHQIIDRIGRARAGEAVDVFTPTGFRDLDRMLNGGWYGGDLIVLAGRPGMGKTVVGCAIAAEVARKGAGAIVFSLEIDQIQTASRILAHRAYSHRLPISFGRITSARDITDEEEGRIQSAAASLESWPLVVDDTPRLTVVQIAQRAKAEKERLAKSGITLSVIVVDYLKFVKASDRYRGQRVYEVGEISAGLKEMAKELNVTVVLCAQLNRGVESRADKRPDLADLRESGDLEADADAVCFLYRHYYYLTRSTEFRNGDREATDLAIACEHDLEFIIAKNRKGSTGTVKLFCDIACSHVSQSQLNFGGYRP